MILSDLHLKSHHSGCFGENGLWRVSKCGSKETCQEAVALRLMVAWPMVVAVEMIRIWIYSKVEPKQLSVGMKERLKVLNLLQKNHTCFLPHISLITCCRDLDWVHERRRHFSWALKVN